MIKAILFLIVSLAFTSHAWGQTTSVQTPILKSPELAGGSSRCVPAVNQANDLCFTQTESVQAKAAGAAVFGASSVPSEIVPTSMFAVQGADLGTTANSNAVSLCDQAYKLCHKGCNADLQKLQIAQRGEGTSHAQADETELRKTIQACSQFQKRALAFAGGAAETVRAGAQAGEVRDAAAASGAGGEGFFSEHKKEIAAGVIGLGLGYLLGKKKDKDKKESTSTEPTTTPTTNTAISCGADEAYQNSSCTEQLIKECSCIASIGSNRCTLFTNNYCGFNTPTNTVNTAPGLGSQLCQDAMAQSYCANAAQADNRKVCYSCRSLTDRKALACGQSLGKESSNEEILRYKALCPDDPINATPRWASVTPESERDSLSGGRVVVADKNSPQAVVINNNNLNRSLASTDVAPRFGPGVLSRASQTIQEICDRGEANYCGLRRGISDSVEKE
ncbi:MAG: hypothetical protein K1X29_03450 [Bdellovibrionales bacterium]|nr:hypothetical protein [Bdellovibrionales bacterium]